MHTEEIDDAGIGYDARPECVKLSILLLAEFLDDAMDKEVGRWADGDLSSGFKVVFSAQDIVRRIIEDNENGRGGPLLDSERPMLARLRQDMVEAIAMIDAIKYCTLDQ